VERRREEGRKEERSEKKRKEERDYYRLKLETF
jgi:hypothetical protein